MLVRGQVGLAGRIREREAAGLVMLGSSGCPAGDVSSDLQGIRGGKGLAYNGDTPAPSKLVGCLAVGSHVGAQPVDKGRLHGWRLVDGALRPQMATACGRWILSLGLRGSYVRVWDAGVAQADAFAAAEAAEVCVAAFAGYQRGGIFAARDSRRSGGLNDVLVGYSYAVG